MKINDFLKEGVPGYDKLDLQHKIIIKHILKLQEDMELVKTYVNMPKYHVPWGDYKTYSKAAAAYMRGRDGNEVSLPWTEIRKRIKDENFEEYYLNV